MPKFSSMIVDGCRKYPVGVYCLLAFLITWGMKYWYALARADNTLPSFNFSLLAQAGPSLSALVLIALTEGRSGLRRTVQSILNWRVGFGWILLALLFEPVLFFTITILYSLWHPEFQLPSGFSLLSAATSLTIVFFTGLFRWGLTEEIGWRGWMFPKLQNRMSPFAASLVLSLVNTLWHIHPNALPDIATVREGTNLIGFYPEAIERLIITIPITLAITYIYTNTKGSLLAMMIFHSASNTSYFWVDETFGIVKSNFFRTSFLVALIVIGVVFAFLVLRQKQRSGAGRIETLIT